MGFNPAEVLSSTLGMSPMNLWWIRICPNMVDAPNVWPQDVINNWTLGEEHDEPGDFGLPYCKCMDLCRFSKASILAPLIEGNINTLSLMKSPFFSLQPSIFADEIPVCWFNLQFSWWNLAFHLQNWHVWPVFGQPAMSLARWHRDHMEDAGHPNSLGHQASGMGMRSWYTLW